MPFLDFSVICCDARGNATSQVAWMPGKSLLIPALFCRSVIFVLLKKLASWPRIKVQLPLLHMAVGENVLGLEQGVHLQMHVYCKHRTALKAHTPTCRKGNFLTCLHSQEF